MLSWKCKPPIIIQAVHARPIKKGLRFDTIAHAAQPVKATAYIVAVIVTAVLLCIVIVFCIDPVNVLDIPLALLHLLSM